MAARVIHVEVTGKDGPALQKFYSDVFGWDLDTNNPDGYGMIRQDNGITGGKLRRFNRIDCVGRPPFRNMTA